MERVTDLAVTVQQVVEGYSGRAWRASTYTVADHQRRLYAIITVPDVPRPFPARIVVMARVKDDQVLIDEDTTDRPLVDELVRAGVPREKIVLVYAGQSLTYGEINQNTHNVGLKHASILPEIRRNCFGLSIRAR